ncbi:MAG TPA: GNAT family N-acetyltransferase [Parvibaculum sp.]|uniref:GNAT family N-acetyltransferase n=1 Tax=Parvibaculum sp. TaxID=2024848 RepID=UPI002C46535B|nr:GNAT family N-acetyltransferase [Parvibaculum sp.]HMM13319.1 GNAT family N-acetyltransferase [Parvibaculum sp.]
MSWLRHGFEINTDKSKLDRESILRMLRATYWASEVPPEDLWTSIVNSRAYGMYSPDGEQAGFARLVTDTTRFAWLSDVYVLPVHRGRGLGKWLVDTVLADPAIEKVRRIMLNTKDAQILYERIGFTTLQGEEAAATMQLLR